jgi:hypothetical protein
MKEYRVKEKLKEYIKRKLLGDTDCELCSKMSR